MFVCAACSRRGGEAKQVYPNNGFNLKFKFEQIKRTNTRSETTDQYLDVCPRTHNLLTAQIRGTPLLMFLYTLSRLPAETKESGNRPASTDSRPDLPERIRFANRPTHAT